MFLNMFFYLRHLIMAMIYHMIQLVPKSGLIADNATPYRHYKHNDCHHAFGDIQRFFHVIFAFFHTP